MSPTTVLAGTKRKRYIPVEKDVSVKLTGKLHHGFKEIRKSVKKAKTFETQKLVKKLKDLRKPARNASVVAKDINNLETELEYLKKIDQERIAQLALSSKIRKDRILSSHEVLTSVLSSVTPISNQEACYLKVESRLLSSKIVAGEVNSVLNGLKAVLDPKVKAEPTGASVETAGDMEDGSEGGVSEDESEVGGVGVHMNDEKTPEGQNEVVDEADDMVDDDGWESGSIDPGIRADSEDDDSISSVPPHKRLKPVPTSSVDTASKFLPSLSVGFIKGDQDSDIEESDEENAQAGRKNRRGQKARQAIWEKKYGKYAKHVKKKREEVEALATAKQLGKRLDRGWNGSHSHSRTQQPFGSTKDSRPGAREVERPAHPSWEAKKKLKEKEGAKILPSQGKKIVFG